MKYIFSNGLKLEVREISEVIYQLDIKDKKIPLPIITKKIVSDDKARDICKKLSEAKNYRRVK